MRSIRMLLPKDRPFPACLLSWSPPHWTMEEAGLISADIVDEPVFQNFQPAGEFYPGTRQCILSLLYRDINQTSCYGIMRGWINAWYSSLTDSLRLRMPISVSPASSQPSSDFMRTLSAKGRKYTAGIIQGAVGYDTESIDPGRF